MSTNSAIGKTLPIMNLETALEQLGSAASSGQFSDGAVENIRTWLTQPQYAAYTDQIVEHIAQQKWQALDDAFWTIIPFGTGGRRGRMYPIGSNTINERTIGESAQGLADYVRQQSDDAASLACAIAYDTRHRSLEFARLSAEIMIAAGFTVYFLEGYRSTPELSFTVRYKKCNCGIMVTASHNPPSDNAVKVYWSTGGQILPPHDRGVIDCVMQAKEIQRTPFDDAVADGKIIACQDEVDTAFVAAVAAEALPGPRDVRIIYSPLHGVGASAVCPVLQADGFTDVELFADHAEPDGDFPNVPGHVSNPENPAVFDSIVERAKETSADLAMASDPDCDRLGCAAPLTTAPNAPWQTFTGNQIGALLADYILESRRAAGTLTGEHYVVKTLVTTELIRRIADSYGVQTHGDLLVGFKWIGGIMDQVGADRFVFGAEESHGYLVGQYARDKDASVTAMLLAELAAKLKADGQTLHEKLDAIFWQHGAHAENTVSVTMPGAEGMKQIQAVMERFRAAPPSSLAGMKIARVRDYQHGTVVVPGGKMGVPSSKTGPLEGPTGDMVMLDLKSTGNYVAVRPSGTEPKVKFYMFTFEPAEQLANLDTTKEELADRLSALEQDLRAFANA